jgi:hypothetical protein
MTPRRRAGGHVRNVENRSAAGRFSAFSMSTARNMEIRADALRFSTSGMR